MRAVMRLVEIDAALARLGAEQHRWRAAREQITLLWTAPCDLTEAAMAVASFQRAVTDAGT